MTDVFISYSHQNRDAAQIIAEKVAAKGYEVWWDRELIAGDDYADVIEKVIDQAKAVIVVWSEVSRKSYWVRDEAAVGRDRNRLLPVVIDNNPPPLGFRQIHTVNLAGWDGHSEGPLEDIFLGLQGLVGTASSAIVPEAPVTSTNPFGAPVDTPRSTPSPTQNQTSDTPDMGSKIFAGVNARPNQKSMQSIMKEEKRQRSFMATFWLTSLVISGLMSLALGLYANSTDSFSGEHWIINTITAFLFVGAGLIVGRFIIAIGRRLAKRKSVKYFDSPTVWSFSVSAVATVLMFWIMIVDTPDVEGESLSDAVFLSPLIGFVMFFPFLAVVTLIIGVLKGTRRKSFTSEVEETAELFR